MALDTKVELVTRSRYLRERVTSTSAPCKQPAYSIMRIPLPFSLPFELDIVCHTPGHPVRWTGATDADMPAERSFLPVQLRCVRRPPWGDPANFREAVEPSEILPETPTHAGVGAANPPSQALSVIESVNDLSSAELSAAALLAEKLQVINEWVDQAPADARQERHHVASQFRECLTNPAATEIQIRFTRSVTSLPPIAVPSCVTNIMLFACSGLETPPDLSHCAQLQQLAILQCDDLQSPPDLSACTDLKKLCVANCHSLIAAPDISACTQLINVIVVNCRNLRTFPNFAGNTTLKKLLLTQCSNAETPVDVSRCTALQELSLEGCQNITAVALAGCEQLTNVTVAGCVSLATMPPLSHLQRLDVLAMDGVPLTSLPEDMLQLPRNCRITLDASRLSDAIRNRLDHILNAPGYSGPRIEYPLGAPSPDTPVRPLDQEVAAWRDEAPVETQQALSEFDWRELPQQDNTAAFSTFLARVRETNDYRHPSHALKTATQERVAKLLIKLQNDPTLREDCFNLALDAINTCGDRVALRLMDMENLAMTHEASAAIDAGRYDEDPRALIELCKVQHRLAIIATEAENKVAGMHFTDPIEVHLGYITKLAEPCQLPVQISTMLYPACAGVTEDDLAAVTRKLSNAGLSSEECVANDHAYQRALAGSGLMRKLLQRLRPAEMRAAYADNDALIAQSQNQLRAQMDALNPVATDYRQESRRLMVEFRAVEIDIPVLNTLALVQDFLVTHDIAGALNESALPQATSK